MPSSPTLVDELLAALDRLERDLGVAPADNAFEGRRTTADLQPARPRRRFARVPGAPRTCCRSSSGCSTPAACCRRCRRSPSGPTRRPSRSTPTTSSSRCPSRTRRWCATRCGRSPTSPRPTAPPGWCRASHLADSPDLTAALRLDPRRDGGGAACSCGTAACGTAAARTPPPSAGSASPATTAPATSASRRTSSWASPAPSPAASTAGWPRLCGYGDLQRAHRPHRQARPRRAAGRRPARRHGLGRHLRRRRAQARGPRAAAMAASASSGRQTSRSGRYGSGLL